MLKENAKSSKAYVPAPLLQNENMERGKSRMWWCGLFLLFIVDVFS